MQRKDPQEVVNIYFKEGTLQRTGEKLGGITRERVRQIIKEAGYSVKKVKAERRKMQIEEINQLVKSNSQRIFVAKDLKKLCQSEGILISLARAREIMKEQGMEMIRGRRGIKKEELISLLESLGVKGTAKYFNTTIPGVYARMYYHGIRMKELKF